LGKKNGDFGKKKKKKKKSKKKEKLNPKKGVDPYRQ